MRHLGYNMEDLTPNPPNPDRSARTGTVRENPEGPLIFYLPDRYLECVADVPCLQKFIADKGCTILLVGFGNWPLGDHARGLWPLERYESAVRSLLGLMLTLDQNLEVAWVSMPPFPDDPSVYEVPLRNWRSQPVIQAYNAAAASMCKRAGVKFIDIFNVGVALHDVTYDGHHYDLPVGREMTRALLANLKTFAQWNAGLNA